MPAPRIVAMAGSLRKGSYNKTLVRAAAEMARNAGAEVDVLDLADLALPLYDGDHEEAHGLPEGAKALKAKMAAADGLLLACPEYNSSITAAMKNALDWASRAAPGEKGMPSFQGKVAALVAASPGALGGLRGLVTVRMILGNVGVIVLPDQLAISKAHEAFDDGGKLKDEKQAASLARIAKALVETCAKLKGA